MIVRWTRRAEADLFDQCDHIAKNDPNLAARIGAEIFATIEGLGEFPFRGRAGRVAGTRQDSTVVLQHPLAGSDHETKFERVAAALAEDYEMVEELLQLCHRAIAIKA